jgi:type II secretory pathway predicted ATPase ExeA
MAHLHILLNYEWDASALLPLVLIGLPELESHLARRTNRSLLTRIRQRFLIDSASVDDTAEYVRHRLGAAGAAHTLFPDDAIAELHASSQGSPGEIDRIATGSLRDAARRRKELVDKDLVVRAAPILVRDEQAAVVVIGTGTRRRRRTSASAQRAGRS